MLSILKKLPLPQPGLVNSKTGATKLTQMSIMKMTMMTMTMKMKMNTSIITIMNTNTKNTSTIITIITTNTVSMKTMMKALLMNITSIPLSIIVGDHLIKKNSSIGLKIMVATSSERKVFATSSVKRDTLAYMNRQEDREN